MDWEAQILEVCDRYKISPEVYTSDPDARELIARELGFPSYQVFEKLPTPSEILDGRGNDLLVGHRLQQLPLIKSCLESMAHNYYLRESREELEIQARNFVKYVKEHFDYEYIMAAKELMKTWPGISEILEVNDDRS